MNHYPPSILALIRSLSRLPGIGEKTAERLALHVIRSPRAEVDQLSRSLVEAKEKVRLCGECFSLSDSDTCHVCRDPGRDTGVLCVVEQPGDMVAIEKSGAFRGRYHVLSGALSPIDGIGPQDLRIRELVEKVARGGIRELVIATGTSVEGEATAAYLAECLQGFPVKVTRIASGVPVGGDLKYIDPVTLRKAMEARRDL